MLAPIKDAVLKLNLSRWNALNPFSNSFSGGMLRRAWDPWRKQESFQPCCWDPRWIGPTDIWLMLKTLCHTDMMLRLSKNKPIKIQNCRIKLTECLQTNCVMSPTHWWASNWRQLARALPQTPVLWWIEIYARQNVTSLCKAVNICTINVQCCDSLCNSVASAKYRDEHPSDEVRTKQIRSFELMAKSGSPSSTFCLLIRVNWGGYS